MSGSTWFFIYLAVILKIPVFAGLYLVWWASKEPEPEDAPGASGNDHHFRRWRREPSPPRSPRRGPHAPDARPLPACPGARTHAVARANRPRVASHSF